MDSVSHAYVQLLMLVAIMVPLHCSGMCGPIVIACRFDSGTSGWRRILTTAFRLALYQLGRCSAYVPFGIAVGLAGQAMASGFRSAQLILVYALAGGFLLAGVIQSGALERWLPKRSSEAPTPGWAGRLLGNMQRHPARRAFLLGLALAFMPCGLTFQALGIAAGSQSPWHGGVIMALLVAATSAPLFVFALLPGCFDSLRRRLRVHPEAIASFLVGALMLNHALAMHGIIRHFGFHIGRYPVMFW